MDYDKKNKVAISLERKIHSNMNRNTLCMKCYESVKQITEDSDLANEVDELIKNWPRHISSTKYPKLTEADITKECLPQHSANGSKNLKKMQQLANDPDKLQKMEAGKLRYQQDMCRFCWDEIIIKHGPGTCQACSDTIDHFQENIDSFQDRNLMSFEQAYMDHMAAKTEMTKELTDKVRMYNIMANAQFVEELKNITDVAERTKLVVYFLDQCKARAIRKSSYDREAGRPYKYQPPVINRRLEAILDVYEQFTSFTLIFVALSLLLVFFTLRRCFLARKSATKQPSFDVESQTWTTN